MKAFEKHTPSYRHKNLMLYLNLATAALLRPIEGQSAPEFWDSDNADRELVQGNLQNVITGIKEYQSFPWHRPQVDKEIWQDGEVRLFLFKSKGRKTCKTILLIPSLINGSQILDMLPERSFAGWLAEQGHDVYLIDWGNLPDDPELQNFAILLAQKFKKILEQFNEPVIGIGYCMGGALLAAAYTLYPSAFKALTFIATPWDFACRENKDFPQAVRAWWKTNACKLAKQKNLPAENLQTVFASLDPDLVVRKFSSFAQMDKSSFEAKLFVAVEDWVNSGADLPFALVEEMAQSWYLDNLTLKGDWQVAGQRITASQIAPPAYIILPQRDKIVPPMSAKALAQQIPHAEILKADCGHIAMMVGSRAKHDIWQPLHKWIQALT